MFHNVAMATLSYGLCGSLLLVTVALLGCNGQASDGQVDAGAATGGSIANGGSHMGSGGAASGGNGGTGNGNGGADCSVFQDDAGWSVVVSVINRTSQAIHVGQQEVTCSHPPLFEVEDGTGHKLADFGACRSACADVMRQGSVGCPAVCLFPSAVTLQPDEGTNVLWNGLDLQQTRLSEECIPADDPVLSTACDRAVQIMPGTFTFTAHAGTELDCLQTTGTCGDCMAQGEGGCATSATIGGTILSAQTTVELDASYGVGGGDVPDGVTGIGATLPIEIVFDD